MNKLILAVALIAMPVAAQAADCDYLTEDYLDKVAAYKGTVELMSQYDQKLQLAKETGDELSADTYRSMGKSVAYSIAGQSPNVISAAERLKKAGGCGSPIKTIDAVIATANDFYSLSKKFIIENK